MHIMNCYATKECANYELKSIFQEMKQNYKIDFSHKKKVAHATCVILTMHDMLCYNSHQAHFNNWWHLLINKRIVK